jgi:hypothetical protein
MSIRADVQELEFLNSEMKVLRRRMKFLRDKQKATEGRIAQFLKAKEQPGVKFQGTALILEEKEKAQHKRPKDKDADTITVLERLGVENPQEALKDIIAARRGETQKTERLKVKKYKQP